jgi:hypothetical protein
VPLPPEDEAPLRQLVSLLGPLPSPWPEWLAASGPGWTSWATVDRQLLQWELHRVPLEPLEVMQGLLDGRALVLVSQRGAPVQLAGFTPLVRVDLADPPLSDPLPLYAPLRQPLPNSPQYGEHLLDHCRRLVLGQAGLTIVLVDEAGLRLPLAAALGGVGLPVVRIEGGDSGRLYWLPQNGYARRRADGSVFLEDASALMQRDPCEADPYRLRLELTDPAHPVCFAYDALCTRVLLKRELEKRKPLLQIQQGASLQALISMNASGRVMDRVTRHFKAPPMKW